MSDVVDNARLGRFELVEDGLTALATYRRVGARVTIPHVEAPVPLRGKGTAGRLMEGIVALARRRRVQDRSELSLRVRLVPAASGSRRRCSGAHVNPFFTGAALKRLR